MNSILLVLIFSVLSTQAQYDMEANMGISQDDPELNPLDVEEEGCPKIENLRNVNLKQILGQWHLPYMSNHWIRYMTKSMHGKFMKQSSMGRICMKINVKQLPAGSSPPNNTDATIWLQSKCPRTGAEWNLACAPYDSLNSKWYCTDLEGKYKERESFIYVADTDGKTWALVIRCFPNNGMNWAIFSKVKHLDAGLVKSLLQEVELMGFKLFNIVEVPYEKCMTKP